MPRAQLQHPAPRRSGFCSSGKSENSVSKLAQHQSMQLRRGSNRPCPQPKKHIGWIDRNMAPAESEMSCADEGPEIHKVLEAFRGSPHASGCPGLESPCSDASLSPVSTS
jgi:hypothetical protein